MDETPVTCAACGHVPEGDDIPEFEHPEDAWECSACGATNSFDESFG